MNQHSPKYVTVYHQIKSEILSGVYNSGAFLPTESELMAQYGASRTTIRRAISFLKGEKLVDVRQGRGTEVLDARSSPTAFDLTKSQEFSHVAFSNRFLVDEDWNVTTQGAVVDRLPAEIKIADSLGVKIGSELYRLQRVKLINDTIFAYVVSYVPAAVAPGLERYSGSIVNLDSFLKENYGVAVNVVKETITSARSGFLESKLLNVNTGSPLLLLRRTASDGTSVIEYSEIIIRPDLYEMEITTTKNAGDNKAMQSAGPSIFESEVLS